MLRQLHIRDFAVIEEIEISLENGMTVFTGETGAGKSIIIDALGLVLGDRADSTVIRRDCGKTEITAIFEPVHSAELGSLLEEQDITLDDELILRRVINRDGRSRAYINGSPVTVSLLRDMGEQLIDIHGQHAHQSLMKPAVQRELLDTYGQHNQELKAVSDVFNNWQATRGEIETLTGDPRDRNDKLALLEYQVQELDALKMETGEMDALDDEYRKLSNARNIIETGQKIYDGLSGNENSIRHYLHQFNNDLNEITRFDRKFEPIQEMLDSAAIQLNEASDELRHYLDNIEIDPDRLQVVEDRISAIQDLARKHQVQPAMLPQHYADLVSELNKIKNNEERLVTLEKQLTHYENAYNKAAEILNQRRMETALNLSREVTEKIQQLGMPGGDVSIQVQTGLKDTFSPHGMDKIEFLVAINPGQDLLPLNKVASGGELSRISLAIQVVANKDKKIPTLIFDEVDSGIGGGVAEIVGKLLHDLAAKNQVFCVTHLPQVASQGDHHMLVNKVTLADTTLTQVTNLSGQDRVDEIARMLGGLNITGQTRAHAQEMLKQVK